MKSKLLISTTVLFFAFHAFAETVKLKATFQITDLYQMDSSILLEGISRDMSGVLRIETNEGKLEFNIEPSGEKLNSTLFVLKAKNKVTFLESGSEAETLNAKIEYAPDGRVLSLDVYDSKLNEEFQDEIRATKEQIMPTSLRPTV